MDDAGAADSPGRQQEECVDITPRTPYHRSDTLTITSMTTRASGNIEAFLGALSGYAPSALRVNS
jgi:hypothetical protein